MPQYEPQADNKIKYYARIICLLILLVILSTALVFSAISPTLAAEVTMEVYQQVGHKIFGQETSLDIFDNPKLNGQKLVAPFTEGSYTFAVYNNSDSDLLPYTLAIKGTNLDNIPLVFSLQRNGTYIYGGANDADMRPLSEFNLEETLLDGKKTDLYTIKWKWNTVSDEIDTAIGNAAVERDIIYKLEIIVTGTIYETDTSEPNQPETTAPETNPPETTAPETNPPETNKPETSPPDFHNPEPDAPEPEASEPDTPEAEASEPDKSEPEVSDPNAEASEPDKSEPDKPELNQSESPTEPASEQNNEAAEASEFETPEEVVHEYTLIQDGDLWLVLDANGVPLGYIDFPYESWEEIEANLIPLGVITALREEENKKDSPKTNDNTNIGFWVIIIIVSTLILLIFLKRRKNKNENTTKNM